MVDAAAAGCAAGFAIALKPTNVLFLAAPLVAFAAARRARELGAFTAALVPCLLTYVLWREKGLGHFGGWSEALLVPGPTGFTSFNFQAKFIQLQTLSWSPRLLEWIAVAGFVALLKRSPVKALFFGTWFLAYVVALGTSRVTDPYSVSFWHLMLPAFPAYCVLMGSLPLLWPRADRTIAERFPYRPRRLVPVAVPALLALLIPLAAVAAAPSLHRANVAAELQVDNELVPIDNSLGARAAVVQGRVTLSWQARKLPAKVFYAIYRSPRRWHVVLGSTPVPVNEGLRCSEGSGATRCIFEMPRIAVTKDTTFSEVTVPGAFTYRVAVLANYLNDTSLGSATSLSPPLDVRVR
jgi:hypothetical protein